MGMGRIKWLQMLPMLQRRTPIRATKGSLRWEREAAAFAFLNRLPADTARLLCCHCHRWPHQPSHLPSFLTILSLLKGKYYMGDGMGQQLSLLRLREIDCHTNKQTLTRCPFVFLLSVSSVDCLQLAVGIAVLASYNTNVTI
jgi:hypothetical protein